mgnify:CR=1 FL=1
MNLNALKGAGEVEFAIFLEHLREYDPTTWLELPKAACPPPQSSIAFGRAGNGPSGHSQVVG